MAIETRDPSTPALPLNDAEAERARQEAEAANAFVQVTKVEVPTEAESDKATAAAAEAAQPVPKTDICTFSTGVRLKIKPVPPMFIRRAQMQLWKPSPPLWRNPNTEREEYNEADPDYLEAARIYNEEVEFAAIRALILSGSSLDYCPPEMPRPEDQTWIDNAIEAGCPYEFKTERGRWLAWVEDVAVGSLEDFMALGMSIGRLTGIPEEDMARAIDAFRNRGERAADSEPDLPAGNRDGDHLPSATGGVGAGD